MTEHSPLHGVRVVESAGWAGAYAGKLLAEAGADVVRVVSPGGDSLASEPPFFGASGVSIQETWYNLGKRVVELDLQSAEGKQALHTLLAGADILFEDWVPGAEPLVANDIPPGVVRVSLTHTGRNVPQLVTNDLIGNALSGGASVTGAAHTPPLSGYGNQTHHTVGLYALICALSALRAQRKTGCGQHVDLSAHEALVSCTEQLLMQKFFAGTWPADAKRQGSLHWSGVYAVYPDRNGKGMMVTAALRFLEDVLPWMEADGMAAELADKSQFADILSLVRQAPLVMQRMREWVATKDADTFFFEAQAKHLSWGPSVAIPEVVKNPQAAARGYYQDAAIPGVGTVKVPGRAFRTDADGARPAPAARVTVRDLAWEPRPTASQAPALPSARPLEGVRILDFTHVLAGPFGTRALADLGADIIKVSTASRAGGANSPAHPYYTSWNRSKRSIMLNMAVPRGIEVARKLAAASDAITENFSAGVLRRWGIDRASLSTVNPKLTVVSMGGMGQDGPWRDFVTFAPTIHALIGLTYLTNPPGEHLLGYGFSLTDHLSGLAGAVAVLEGVEHARRTGQGLDVDLSQYELGLGLMGPALIDHLANGVEPEPVGNRHPFAAWAPHGIYPSAGEDRWVAIAVRGDAEWAALCGLMARPELASDVRFATHDARVREQDALDALLADWTRGQDRYAVMAACQSAGVAAGAVQTASDLVDGDPTLAARQFFGMAEAPGETPAHPIDRFPALFDGVRPPHYEAAHQLGADTFDVLTGVIGMSDDEVAELMGEGVLS